MPLFISAETIRTELATRIETATGRATRIDGPVSFSVIPTARLSAEGIGIAGLASDTEAFSVESVSFGLSLLPLLTGNIEIYGVTITRPFILIETDADGRTNWSTDNAGIDASPGSIEDMIASTKPQKQTATEDTLTVLERLSIGRVKIADGTLVWRDIASDTEERLEEIDFDIRVPRLDGAGTAEGSFTRLGVRQSLELEVGERPDPNRLEAIPVALNLSADGGAITVTGTAMSGESLFEGSVETEGGSFADFAKIFGVDLPSLPAFGEFNTAARLNASATQIRVDEFALDFGGIKARGGAVVGLDRERPGVGLKLVAETIDTSLFVPEGESTEDGTVEPRTPGTAVSDEIDFSALRMVDANVEIAANEILIGTVPVTNVGIDAQLVNGALTANLRSAAVNGAPANGAISVDANGEAPSIKGNIKVDGLDAAGVVALAGVESPIDAGAIGADVAFSTRGRTESQLIQNLDGSGSVSLTDGRLSGLDIAEYVGGDQAANEINDVDLTAQFSSLTAPIDAKGGLTWRGERFNISGRGDPRAFADAGTTPVSLNASSQRVNFGFNGEAGVSGLGSGTVSLSTPSLRNLLAWIGQPLPAGGGLGAFSIRGPISLSEDAFSFETADFTLDGSEGIGTGKLTFGGKPKVTAGLSMKRLDVTPYLTASGTTASGGGAAQQSTNGASGWSSEPLGFDGLNAIDANLNLKADEIIADQIRIGPSLLTAKIDSGRLTAELTEMSLYSGIGVGTLSIDGASSTPSLAAFFRLDEIDALPFLRDAAGFSWIEGTASFSFDIRAAGNSEAALMSALDGKGAMDFRDGAIRGIDIPNMVRNLSIETLLGWQQSSDAKTEFTQLSGTYTIENGILTNQDLNLIGPLLRVTGAGTVDIPDKTLAYRVDPKIVASLEGQGGAQDLEGFAVPIRIEGAWSRPRIYPEIEGILQNPQQALDQLKKLGGGLFGRSGGTDQQPAEAAGTSVEDRINEELTKGLGKLFGSGKSDAPAAVEGNGQDATVPAAEQAPIAQPQAEQQPVELSPAPASPSRPTPTEAQPGTAAPAAPPPIVQPPAQPPQAEQQAESVPLPVPRPVDGLPEPQPAERAVQPAEPAPAEPPAEQEPAEPQPAAPQIIQEPAAPQPVQTEAVQQPPQDAAPGEQPPAAETAPEQPSDASPADPSPGNDGTGSGASSPSIDQPVDFLKSLLGQ